MIQIEFMFIPVKSLGITAFKLVFLNLSYLFSI